MTVERIIWLLLKPRVVLEYFIISWLRRNEKYPLVDLKLKILISP